MSGSSYKKIKEIPIATDILIGNIMKGRWAQRRVHRKAPHGHRHAPAGGVGKAKKTIMYPPEGGWVGDNNAK